jgi:hypothetical protein
MDRETQYFDEGKALTDNVLYRVRGVPGVRRAVPLYKGIARALAPDGKFRQVVLFGIDDASLVGAGQTFYLFTLENLKHYGALKAIGVTDLRLIGMILLQALVVGSGGGGRCTLDDRHLRAALALNQGRLGRAKARVRTAEATLADTRERLRFAERVQNPLAISAEELSRRRHAVKTVAAGLEEARAAVTVAEAEIGTVETEIERSTVRAPIAGEVLQVKVRAGEFAVAGSTPSPSSAHRGQRRAGGHPRAPSALSLRARGPADLGRPADGCVHRSRGGRADQFPQGGRTRDARARRKGRAAMSTVHRSAAESRSPSNH